MASHIFSSVALAIYISALAVFAMGPSYSNPAGGGGGGAASPAANGASTGGYGAPGAGYGGSAAAPGGYGAGGSAAAPGGYGAGAGNFRGQPAPQANINNAPQGYPGYPQGGQVMDQSGYRYPQQQQQQQQRFQLQDPEGNIFFTSNYNLFKQYEGMTEQAKNNMRVMLSALEEKKNEIIYLEQQSQMGGPAQSAYGRMPPNAMAAGQPSRQPMPQTMQPQSPQMQMGQGNGMPMGQGNGMPMGQGNGMPMSQANGMPPQMQQSSVNPGHMGTRGPTTTPAAAAAAAQQIAAQRAANPGMVTTAAKPGTPGYTATRAPVDSDYTDSD